MSSWRWLERMRDTIEAKYPVRRLHFTIHLQRGEPSRSDVSQLGSFHRMPDNIYGIGRKSSPDTNSQASWDETGSRNLRGSRSSITDFSETPKTRINVKREKKLDTRSQLGPSPLPALTEKDFSAKQYDDWPAGVKKKAWMRPRHVKRWQRDLIVRMEYNREKRRLNEIVKMKNYVEIEERIRRRKQGLPELPIVHETMFGKTSRRERRRRKLENEERKGEVLWTSRPRDINVLYDGPREEWGWHWHSYEQQNTDDKKQLPYSYEQERPKSGKPDEDHDSNRQEKFQEANTVDTLEARAVKRLDKFQRYVERLPEFEDTLERQGGISLLPSPQKDLSVNPASEAVAVQPEFEIPPIVPGRGALLVAGLYDILKEGKWDIEKVARLEKFKHAKLLPYQICQVLKQLKDWQVALEFFTWAKSIPVFKHDTLDYSTMIMVLGRCGHYVEARKLFDEMVVEQIPIDKFTVNNMIKCYGRGNRVDDALAFYQQVSTGTCEPDSCTYALLMDLLGKAGRVTEMRQLFLDLKAASFKPDTYLFNSMIYNFGKWGDMSTVSEAAEQMTLSGVEYTTVTYATLIHLYTKVLDFKSAERTYSAYLQSHLEPDIYVFNSVIQLLGVAGRCREAEWAMEDIERAGLRADAFSYCTMISAWGRQGCAREAKAWFTKAQRRGVSPTPEMCNALMDAFLKAGKLESVSSLLDSMPEWGVRPTLETYTYLLNVYTECSEGYVKQLRELLKKTGHSADKFLQQVFEGRVTGTELSCFAQEFFEKARVEEKPGWALKFANAIVHYLQIFGYINEAHRVFEAAMETRLFPRELVEDEAGQWNIWLISMDEGTAVVALGQALQLCTQLLVEHGKVPAKVTVFSGTGRQKNTKTTLAVQSTLDGLGAPFEADPMLPRFDADGLNFYEWVKLPKRETLVEKVYKRVFSQLPASLSTLL